MSPTKTLTSILLSAAIAAGSMMPLANAASARNRDFDGRSQRGYHQPEHRNFDRGNWNGGDRSFRSSNRGWQDADEDFGPRRHRSHSGRNVAIGAFAAILGLAIAAEASRSHHYDYRD